MDTREILTKAAAYMEKMGKSDGWYQSPAGEVCAVGAVRMAMFNTVSMWTLDPFSTREYTNALLALSRVIGDSCVLDDHPMSIHDAVTRFSDHHDETEVIETMRKAADLPDWD